MFIGDSLTFTPDTTIKTHEQIYEINHKGFFSIPEVIVDESVVVDPLDPVAITDTLDDVAYWNIETSLSQVIPAEDATRMIVVLSRVDVANIELKVWDRENQIKWSNSGTATEGIFIMTDETSKVTAR